MYFSAVVGLLMVTSRLPDELLSFFISQCLQRNNSIANLSGFGLNEAILR